jgi:hypothetical protein
MAQMGHTDPTVTLGIYAQVINASDEDRKRLRTLVQGSDEDAYLALTGTRSENGTEGEAVNGAAPAAKVAH